MQKYKSNLTSVSGAAVRGASITVLDESGAIASIFLDRAGTLPAGNPLKTAQDGTFEFYAANGRYSLRTDSSGLNVLEEDVILMFDPDDATVSGPIADAIQEAKDAADQAQESADRAQQIVENTVPTFGTYALTMDSLDAVQDDMLVEISQDETRAGARTRYFKRSGNVLEFSVNLDQLRIDLNSQEGAALVGYDGGTVQDVLDNAKPMENYTELRLYTGIATSVRITTSGVSGIFRKDTGDMTSEDNGGTIIVDAVGRRWKREFSGPVNALWFNAIGNGIHEDTECLTAALLSAKNGSLYLPSGRYLVRAPKAAAALTIPAEGVRIFGDGRFASTLITDTDCVLIGATDATNVDIENIGFTGSRTAPLPWQRAIMLRGVVNARVKGCYFHKMGDNPIGFGTNGFGGSDAIPNGTRQCENLSIEDNLIVDCFGTLSILTKMIGTRDTIVRGNIIKNSSGISIESEGAAGGQFAERIIVSGNIVFNVDSFRASGSGSTAGGIGVGEYARIFVVSGNVIDGVRGDTLANGLDISTSPNQTDKSIDEFVIADNVVKNIVAVSGYGNGIALKAGDASVKSMTISSNQVSNATVGISFESAFGSKTLGEISSLTVSANNVSNTTGIGMLFTLLGGSGDIPLKSSAFTGNAVTNSGGHGMSLKAINSAITGNTVTGSAQTGLFTAAGSAFLTISGNTFNENLQSGMALNGDHLTIVGNSAINNGASGITSYGIHVQSGSYALILNNNSSDARPSPKQSYGVRAPNGSTIRSNQLIGNELGAVWGGMANHNTGSYDSGLNRIN